MDSCLRWESVWSTRLRQGLAKVRRTYDFWNRTLQSEAVKLKNIPGSWILWNPNVTDGEENRKFFESTKSFWKVVWIWKWGKWIDWMFCNCTSYEITRKVQESSEFELKCQFPSHQLDRWFLRRSVNSGKPACQFVTPTGSLVSETERELRCCKEDGHLY